MTTVDATAGESGKKRLNLAPIQKFGRSLMLPIAALPVAALLLRFGISDNSPPTNAQVLDYLGTLTRMAAEGLSLGDVGALVRALSSFVRSMLYPNSRVTRLKKGTRAVGQCRLG